MVDRTASWSYSEDFLPEDDALLAARERASELGVTAIAPGAGAALAALAAAAGVTSAVEVGTGTGVGSLYLLRGMKANGVLTTIDAEQENLRAAKQAFAEAGIAHNRTRTIAGRAHEVMGRLTDGAYDLVFLDTEPVELASYVEQALKLLRPGGVLVIGEALWHGRVADPARRDEATVAMRTVTKALRDDESFVTALLPVGGGLFVAVAG